MKLALVSVYDSAIEAYMRPFVAQSEGQALRSFTDEAKREGSDIKAHPEDYALFLLGHFNDNTGKITELQTPQCLCRAHEIGQVPQELVGVN